MNMINRQTFSVNFYTQSRESDASNGASKQVMSSMQIQDPYIRIKPLFHTDSEWTFILKNDYYVRVAVKKGALSQHNDNVTPEEDEFDIISVKVKDIEPNPNSDNPHTWRVNGILLSDPSRSPNREVWIRDGNNELMHASFPVSSIVLTANNYERFVNVIKELEHVVLEEYFGQHGSVNKSDDVQTSSSHEDYSSSEIDEEPTERPSEEPSPGNLSQLRYELEEEEWPVSRFELQDDTEEDPDDTFEGDSLEFDLDRFDINDQQEIEPDAEEEELTTLYDTVTSGFEKFFENEAKFGKFPDNYAQRKMEIGNMALYYEYMLTNIFHEIKALKGDKARYSHKKILRLKRLAMMALFYANEIEGQERLY